jgi:hypothetical protein
MKAASSAAVVVAPASTSIFSAAKKYVSVISAFLVQRPLAAVMGVVAVLGYLWMKLLRTTSSKIKRNGRILNTRTAAASDFVRPERKRFEMYADTYQVAGEASSADVEFDLTITAVAGSVSVALLCRC